MYIPQNFEVTDRKKALEFIKSNAFGQLVSTLEGRLFSSHIPFYYDSERESLICHIAKNNPQWKEVEDQEVLVTFQGPHDYISPSWYESPGVPTWNYQSVHVYGNAFLITETSELKFIVDNLASMYESSLESPWEPEYKESMLKAIIGIEVNVNEIQCKFKLSQNRTAEDREQVIERLMDQGSIQLAEAMKVEL